MTQPLTVVEAQQASQAQETSQASVIRQVATTHAVRQSCMQLRAGEEPGWQAILSPPADAGMATSLSTESYTNARGQAGIRYQWQALPDSPGSLVVDWTLPGTADDFSGVQTITSDARGPVELWVFDGECALRERRRMVFDPITRLPFAVLVLDPDTAAVRRIDLLNPPVPSIPVLATGASSADEVAADASVPAGIASSGLPVVSANSAASAVRVALVDSGVNYLLPAINSRLAREADGSLVGHDFWSLDDRPFDAHASRSPFHLTRHGTRTASVLLREAPFVELVPYRYPRPDMSRMRDLVEHAVDHDVSIIGLPLGGNKREEWAVFDAVAREHPHVLFIASAGNNGRDIDTQPVFPASLNIPNMLVVTSADDFVQPAEGVNWGRESVDYLLPAENVAVLDYSGETVSASGSSYAVPRMVALAARMQRNHPDWRATELIAGIARLFASGSSVRHVSAGYIGDPLSVGFIAVPGAGSVNVSINALIVERSVRLLELNSNLNIYSNRIFGGDHVTGVGDHAGITAVPIDVLVLDDEWSAERIDQAMKTAAGILAQCGISLTDVRIRHIDVPEYLRDLSTGVARTLMDAVRVAGPNRRLTIVLARDTKMQVPFDGEAFGRGNTRSRPWLQDSVWLTLPIVDTGLALAHEMFHVLANSGEHVDQPDNLMQRRTQGDNTALEPQQCAIVREQAVRNGLGRTTSAD